MKLGREYLLSTQDLDIYGISSYYKEPVRIIHGTKDSIVPLRCSEEYLETYGEDNAELKIVEGANHTITRKKQEVVALVREFFNELFPILGYLCAR